MRAALLMWGALLLMCGAPPPPPPLMCGAPPPPPPGRPPPPPPALLAGAATAGLSPAFCALALKGSAIVAASNITAKRPSDFVMIIPPPAQFLWAFNHPTWRMVASFGRNISDHEFVI